jgi:hypothetical protein
MSERGPSNTPNHDPMTLDLTDDDPAPLTDRADMNSPIGSDQAGVGDDVVPERPYLSIGEVLEVLKPEFDGLSIAQVRDLESRGLFTPERTASGYRKFYESDLGRLRDLLTRHGAALSRPVRPRVGGRADRGDGGGAAYGSGSDGNEPTQRVGPSERLPGDPEHRHPAAAARRARAAAALASLNEEAGDRTKARGRSVTGPADGARSSAPGSIGQAQTPGLGGGLGGGLGAGRRTDPASAYASASPGGTPSLPADDDQFEEASTEPVTRNLSLVPPVSSGPPPQAAAEPRRNPLGSMSSGVSLSISELCAASGLAAEQVHELESQSLIRGKTVFSETYYDEDALLVANLARKFLAFGIEPRHLRMFRLTAEREAAFYEQLVTPMLRRRNPEARSEALDALGRLLELGEQLRAVAVRNVLRTSIDR